MFELAPFNRRNNRVARRDDIWDLRGLIDDFFNDSVFPAFFSGGPGMMRTDIRETDKEYVVEVELPGVNKEDIKLDLKDDMLTISVERKEEVNEEKEKYVRRERKYGSYSRSFYVDGIRNEGVKAKYADGILTVNLPKEEGKKETGRSINIE